MAIVSIIIPTFNAARYLTDSILSSLHQTHRDIEIIVVDDGSTDNTRDIVAQFPVCYIYQSNRGPSSARNTGWQASTGEYIQFLDADDILLPTKIERCLTAFTPDVDVVYTNYEYRSADLQTIIIQKAAFTPEGNIFEALLQHTSTIFPPHAPLIRRDAVKRTSLFNEQLKLAEDWYFWIELASSGANFKFVNEPLVWYRNSPNSLSKNPVMMAESRLAACESLRRLSLPLTFNLNRSLADRHHIVALNQWKLKNKRLARKHLRQAIRLSPDATYARQLMILMSYFCKYEIASSLLAHGLRMVRVKEI